MPFEPEPSHGQRRRFATFARLASTYIGEVRQVAERDRQAYVGSQGGIQADRRVGIVLLTAMLALAAIKYLGNPNRMDWLFEGLEASGFHGLAEYVHAWFREGEANQLHGRLYWTFIRLLFYVLLPLVVARALLKDRLSGYGLGLGRLREHRNAYLVCALIVLVPVVVVSYSGAFQEKYPFYKLGETESLWPYFFCWEVLYALQFVAVEFFFRGFLLHGLKSSLGYSSLFVMTVPYLMIHFSKPLPEALGSIIAGLVLGTLSLKSRSIWGGVLLHVVAAWSMDLLSLARQGKL